MTTHRVFNLIVCGALFAALISLDAIGATKPEWQQHLDWSIGNRTPADQVDCPDQYVTTYPECLTGGGRACLMEKAIRSAKDNDYNNALRLSLITQCHNGDAQKAIGGAGPSLVGDYLKSK